MTEQVLSGVKVLDLSWSISGPWSTKLLADYGADVLKVERPPDGDPARMTNPFLDDEPHPEKSLLFSYINLNKKGITLNLKSDIGKEIFKKLVKDADILVESFRPGVMERIGFCYDTLKEINPKIIFTRISSFGQTGPYKHMNASELIFNGMGHDQVNVGNLGRPPLKTGGNMMQYQAGNMAFFHMLAALWSRDIQGNGGECSDIAIRETLLSGGDRAGASTHSFSYSGGTLMRKVDPRLEITSIMPNGFYPCKDGKFLRIMAVLPHWLRFIKLFPELEEKFNYPVDVLNLDRKSEVDEIWYPWIAEKTAQEAMEACQEVKMFATMVATPKDVVESEHFKSRGFWVEAEHPVTGKQIYPAASSIREGWKLRMTAPLLGQHNKEILCDELGYTEKDLKHFSESGIV